MTLNALIWCQKVTRGGLIIDKFFGSSPEDSVYFLTYTKQQRNLLQRVIVRLTLGCKQNEGIGTE